MNDKQMNWVFFWVVVSISTGMILGALARNEAYHDMGIQHNLAHYNSTNGVFQWNWETNK